MQSKATLRRAYVLAAVLSAVSLAPSQGALADGGWCYKTIVAEPTDPCDLSDDYDECLTWCADYPEEGCADETDACEADCVTAWDDALADCPADCGLCDFEESIDDVCDDIDYCFDPGDYVDPGDLSDWGPASFDYPWSSPSKNKPDHTLPFSDIAGWMTQADPKSDPQSVFAAYLLPPIFQPVETPARPAALPTPAPTAGDPVELLSGAQTIGVTDLRFAGPARDLTFTRAYTSRSDDRSVLGSNWTHEYDVILERVTPTSQHPWTPSRCREPDTDLDCRVLNDAGRRSLYVRQAAAVMWLSPTTGTASLHLEDDTFVERSPAGRERRFDAEGYLVSDLDRFGNGVTVEYERTTLYAFYRAICGEYASLYPTEDPRFCRALGALFGEELAGSWRSWGPLTTPEESAPLESPASGGQHWELMPDDHDRLATPDCGLDDDGVMACSEDDVTGLKWASGRLPRPVDDEEWGWAISLTLPFYYRVVEPYLFTCDEGGALWTLADDALCAASLAELDGRWTDWKAAWSASQEHIRHFLDAGAVPMAHTGAPFSVYVTPNNPYGSRRQRPTRVTDAHGRSLTFTYHADETLHGLLARVEGPGGVAVDFDYGSPPDYPRVLNETFLTEATRTDGVWAQDGATDVRTLRYAWQWADDGMGAILDHAALLANALTEALPKPCVACGDGLHGAYHGFAGGPPSPANWWSHCEDTPPSSPCVEACAVETCEPMCALDDAECLDDCEVNCDDSCADCETDCETGCTSACDSYCGDIEDEDDKDECESSCDAACEGDCAETCSECETDCESECPDMCEFPCMSPCLADCESTCGTSVSTAIAQLECGPADTPPYGPPQVETLEAVDLDAGCGAPFPGIPNDDWAVDWRGWLQVPWSGLYAVDLMYSSGAAVAQVSGAPLRGSFETVTGEPCQTSGYGVGNTFCKGEVLHLEAGAFYPVRVGFRDVNWPGCSSIAGWTRARLRLDLLAESGPVPVGAPTERFIVPRDFLYSNVEQTTSTVPLEILHYVSGAADNLVRVERSPDRPEGYVEVESQYDIDPDSPTLDRVLVQRYGGQEGASEPTPGFVTTKPEARFAYGEVDLPPAVGERFPNTQAPALSGDPPSVLGTSAPCAELGSSGPLWDEEDLLDHRARVRAEINRICTWTQVTDRNGQDRFHGLSYSGAVLAEASWDESSSAWVVREQLVNEDGRPWHLRGPTTADTPWSPSDGWRELTWGDPGLPPATAKATRLRGNLTRLVQTPRGGAVLDARVDEHGDLAETWSLGRLTTWAYEPEFNQVERLSRGVIDIQGQDQLAHETVYRFSDGCPAGPVLCPDCGGLAGVDLSDARFWTRWEGLLQRGEDEAAAALVESQAEAIAEAYGLQSADAVVASLATAQPAQPPARTCDPRRPHRVESGRPARGKDRRYVDLDWAPHGLPAAAREVGGVATKWTYHRSCLIGPDPTSCSDDQRGPLASSTSEPVPDAAPFADLLTPCGGGALHPSFSHLAGDVCDDLDGVALPDGLQALLAAGVPDDVTLLSGYDPRGVPLVVEQAGQVRSLSVDADGRSLGWHELVGDVEVELKVQRDAHGRPVHVTLDTDGEIAQRSVLQRDDEGRITYRCMELEEGACLAPSEASDATRQVTTYTHDPEGRLLTATAPSGAWSTYTHDAAGQLTTRTVGAGDEPRHRETLAYSLSGQPISRTTEDLSTPGSMSSPSALLVEVYAWDGLDRLTSRVAPDGLETRLRHTPAGDLAAREVLAADADEVLWYEHFGYDLHRQPIYHDVQGQRAATRIPGLWGRAQVIEQTGAGTTFVLTDARGARVFQRDAAGDVSLSATVPAAGPTTPATRWDLSVTHGPQGARVVARESSLERHGLPTSVTATGFDPVAGQTTQMTLAEYDATGRLLAQTDPQGRTTEYLDRNQAGWPAEVCVEGRCTHLTYDVSGRPTSVVDPSGDITTSHFDPLGQLLGRDTPTVSWFASYDGLGRQTWTSLDGGESTLGYVYDDTGRLTETIAVRDGVSAPYQAFAYDALGRVSSATQHHPSHPGDLTPSVRETWTYDALGRVHQQSIGTPGSPPLTTTHAWTLAGEQWVQTVERPPAVGPSSTWSRTRDQLGRPTRLRRHADPDTSPLDATFDWQGPAYAGREQTYPSAFTWRDARTTDAFGRLLSSAAGPDGATHYALSATRDPAGRLAALITSTATGPTLTETYAYDAMGRLGGLTRTEAAPPPTTWWAPTPTPSAPLQSTWQRDPDIGSLLQITLHAPLAGTPPTPVWSAAPRAEGHQLTAVTLADETWPIAHDPGGRVEAAGDHHYTWDALGRLLAVHDAAGSYLEGYAYTVDGRLAATLDPSGAFSSQLLWEGGELVAEYTANLAVLPSTEQGTSDLTQGYVYTPLWEAAWGPGPKRLLEWWSADEPAPRLTSEDARRSVAGFTQPGEATLSHLLDYGPDGALTVRDSAGQILCHDAATPCANPAGLPFGFGSAWRSSTTGLSWMGHRWMSPSLHQLLGPDPLGYIDAFDPYAYAAFDPINGWDPWGLANQGFADRDTGWTGAAWRGWGFMQGVAPPGVDMALEWMVASPIDENLRADYLDGKRSGAMAGVVASGATAQLGLAAESTLPAAGAACAAGGAETGGLACAGLAVPAVGVGAVVVGTAGVGYYSAKLAGIGPAQPMQMSSGGGTGGAGGPGASPSQGPANPLNGTKYTEKVRAQMRPGLKSGRPDNHGFPLEVDNSARLGSRTTITGGDGIDRTRIELEGSYQGKDGVFEWIIEPDGGVNHRLFKPR